MGGDGSGQAQPCGLLPNGLLPSDDVGSVTRVLEQDRWSIAENRTLQLITCIQPNNQSEERRNSVVNYVRRLIISCFSCQVFTFGSVPLKTYLSDGDIDLTAFSKDIDLKDVWANEVRDILENEEKNETSEFHVKEVQYIQAEVKIIKCLVENIVVDVSFNQLGGLCTLCFLEEIDNLIGQDHLFKRSIILIKAWCYYESRVLGAHYGLISTYTLETLVLYIFHVFNNSFAGPLEVLYRFLEFFSNFDWDNFCVSLWGPVPIKSLPDMTAEPPRKDGGDLLLSQLFLNACSAVYTVLPSGQDNQCLPFVTKHFNVIDPLRTNNNLGRSVSKGNFYRIRSAFQLGAKRLARLLECPKENINAEVDKFFADTWQRHQSGYRPDAIPLNSHHFQASAKDSKNVSNHVNVCFSDSENGLTSSGRISFQPKGLEEDINRSSSNSSFQKVKSLQTSHTEHTGKGMSAGGSIQASKYSRKSRYDYYAKDKLGQPPLQFARTHSSPELTGAGISSLGRQNEVREFRKNHLTSEGPDDTGVVKSLTAKVPGGHDLRSFDDPFPPAHCSSHHDVATSVDTTSTSNSYSDDEFLAGRNHASVSQTLVLHQEEQDFDNMMASMLHNLNGQVQFPTSAPLPAILTSTGYPQRNMGLVPSNIPMMESQWGLNMQFHQVPISSTLPHYLGESGGSLSCTTDINEGHVDHHLHCDEDTGTSQMFIPVDAKFPAPGSDTKKHSSTGGCNFTSSEASGSISPLKTGQATYGRGNKGLFDNDHCEAFVHPNTNDLCQAHRSLESRSLRASHEDSLRNECISETRDSLSIKSTKQSHDKRGRRLSSPVQPDSSYGSMNNGRKYEGPLPDHSSFLMEDEGREWIQQTVTNNDMAENSAVSSTLTSVPGEGYKIPHLESCQLGGSDSVIPVHPMFVYAGSPQGIGNNPGVGSIFYPTGPPVPFYYTFPVRNLSSDSVESDGSCSQPDSKTIQLNSSNQYFGLVDRPDPPEVLSTFSSTRDASFKQSEHMKLDILNSDFTSHWRNLQFGRFCQHTGLPGSPGFASSVVPQIHFQGHFPFDGPGRPISPKVNLLPQNVSCRPQFVPFVPFQVDPNVASDVYQNQGGEFSRYQGQGGSGSYIPKLKIPFRDRQSFNTRNHRGNCNYDRNENEERGGNWISTKARSGSRNQGHTHFNRPGTNPDRIPSTGNQNDRSVDSNRQDRTSSNEAQNLSTRLSHGPVMYGMLPFPAVSSNGVHPVGPAAPFLVYSRYDPNGRFEPSIGQVEFGSFGSEHLSGGSEVPLTVADSSSSAFDWRNDEYLGGSPCSSPDQPSSPRFQRRE